jgi:protein-S-isoprenylcysteine O-methyltransferase Ste14
MPGMVAFVIPAVVLWHIDHTALVQPLGLLILVPGIVALLWCVRDFHVSGRGTLAPWSPPERLVIVGLYRRSRNPMYVSVALVLLGWTVSFGSMALFAYTLVVVAAFHLRVVIGEEPWLARTHGHAWEQYANRVPRWLW